MTWLNFATPWLMKEMQSRNSLWRIKNSEQNLHETSAILESNMTEMKKIHNFKSQHNQAELPSPLRHTQKRDALFKCKMPDE
jgi:small-conductance mechanosensitive channel